MKHLGFRLFSCLWGFNSFLLIWFLFLFNILWIKHSWGNISNRFAVICVSAHICALNRKGIFINSRKIIRRPHFMWRWVGGACVWLRSFFTNTKINSIITADALRPPADKHKRSLFTVCWRSSLQEHCTKWGCARVTRGFYYFMCSCCCSVFKYTLKVEQNLWNNNRNNMK